MIEEEWRPMVDCADYQISNFGRIKSFKRGKCIFLKFTKDRDGYYKVCISLGSAKNRRHCRVHAEVLKAFVGLPLPGQVGCHKNDINTDNQLENLYWGYVKDNERDKFKNGRVLEFENHPNSKLSNIQREEIKQLHKKGIKNGIIAKIYNVHPATIWCIVTNRREKTRKHKDLREFGKIR